MSAHSVKQVQQKLIELGYDVGPTKDDGFAGKATSKAVAKFEADHVLVVTGRITSIIFLDALFAPPKPKETSMNLSLLTLIISHLNLLPFFQQDITTEVKVLNSSASGAEKLATTIAVLEDLVAQAKAAINNAAIPPTTAKAP